MKLGRHRHGLFRRGLFPRTIFALALMIGSRAVVAESPLYRAITPSMADRMVTLTGHDLTVEQLVAIARYGAKVKLAPEARERSRDTYGLLLEAPAEGIPVYLFSRGPGLNREIPIFTGDPLAPANKALIEANQLRGFQNGVRSGAGPEMDDEASVRAMMAVRANTITYDAPSPQLAEMLLDLLNHRITPVVQSRTGTVGEADLALMLNVAGTMVGKGDAYLNGVRMPAATALAKAGLTPLKPFGADQASLTSTNAYAASQAALLTADAQGMLEWTDVIYAMDLNAMNSSITPLARPPQANRPEPWLNWHAGRMLDMLKGSFLFQVDAKRIIQDPDSLRASSIRQGSAWEAWAELRDATLFQINSSDHNPTFRVGLKPRDSWELATPMMMQYYVRGGANSNGKSGYVVSNANWDPYPLANRIEAFTVALANMDQAVLQRMFKFAIPFHTGVAATDVLSADVRGKAAAQGNGTTAVAVWGEIDAQLAPVSPLGIASDNQANGDVESQIQMKVAKARNAVDASRQLLAHDLMTAAYWLDVRKAQDPARSFGPAATAAWSAYRQVSPWQMTAADRPERPAQDLAVEFLTRTPAASFYPSPAAFPKP